MRAARPRRASRRLAGAARGAALLVLTAAAAAAQETAYTLLGGAPGDDFGLTLAVLGDVDADGVSDFAVGARRDDARAVNAGSVSLRSGADGALLRTVLGDAAGDELGTAVAAMGDVDGDGVGDLVVGAPFADVGATNAGLARLVSGATGATLRTFHGAEQDGHVGAAVAGVGDVDLDGTPDFAVGAPGEGPAGPGSGRAYVVSGATGLVLFVVEGAAAGDGCGAAVAGAGDVDGDGVRDVAVGSPGSDAGGADGGRIVVASGAPGAAGAALLARDGAAGDGLGGALAALGDVDGDGRADLAVGAPGGNHVLVLAGTGALLATLPGAAPGQRFGAAVAPCGDVNGDGVPDLVVGADEARPAGIRSGAATVLSGGSWQPLFTHAGSAAAQRMGAAVAGLGDVDGDGFADVLLGAPGDRTNGFGAGLVRVVRGSERVGVAYCPGAGNSTGLPAVLAATGSARIAAADLALRVTGLPAQTTGYFLTSTTQAQVISPGGSSGVLCLGGAIGRFTAPGQVQSSGAAGLFALTVDAGLLPTPTGIVSALAGETWNFQAWYRDVLTGLGLPTSNLSNGLAVTFF